MNKKSLFLRTNSISVLILSAAFLALVVPTVVFGGGGGGGGGDGGGSYAQVSIGGVTGLFEGVALTDLSTTDGIFSGTYNNVDISYNSVTDTWEGSSSEHGDGGYEYLDLTSACYAAGGCERAVAVTQSCRNTTQVNVTVRFAGDGGYSNLFIDDDYKGSITNGSFTLILPHNRSYDGAVEYQVLNRDGSGTYDTAYEEFSFSSPDCTPATPTAVLELNYSDGSTWSGWTTNNITIDQGDRVVTRWSSTNATSCVGSGFSTRSLGYPTSGSLDVTEPIAGATRTYKITCGASGVNAVDSSTVTTRSLPVPTVSLQARRVGGPLRSPDLTIGSGVQAELVWSSTNTTSCTATAGGGFATGSATSGTDTSITEPAPGDTTAYSISCTGPGGTVTDSVTIDMLANEPTVSLRVRKAGTSAWSTSNITIDPIDNVELNWISNDATSCTGSSNPSGGAFATGGATTGTDTTITEPASGSYTTFSVACTGPGGNVSDTLRVTTGVGGPPTLEPTPRIVPVGSETTLEWNTNTNLPETCSLVGPDLNRATLPSVTGEADVTIYGESIFTLTCPGGTVTTTVEVVPVLQET